MGRRASVPAVVLLVLAGAPRAGPATYVENTINPACVAKVFHDPRFNAFEPAARVLAYLDCTTQALGQLWSLGLQLRDTLWQQIVPEFERRRQSAWEHCDQVESVDRYRAEAIAAFEQLQRRIDAILVILRMVQVQREEDVRWQAAHGVLRGAHVDWRAQVRARNQEELWRDSEMYKTAQEAAEWQRSLRDWRPRCSSRACDWVSERQLGLMGSNRYVCMCGQRIESGYLCGTPPGPTR